MKHKGGQRDKKKYMSLCEKSMVLVANIIKLSSLSLANNSFGATSCVRSLEPAHGRKMTKVDVVMQVPITGDHFSSSSYASADVDGKAEDFIRRIRDKIHKNQNDQQHVLG
ncbi:hypothetical protein GBA52_003026 [Prunus armeniaca]|nr:hypothetical protein GBA52_003026 [Prunus armeniaca]